MSRAIRRDDYARIPFDFHDDPDLALVHDTLEDQYGTGYLVWLYWPTIVTSAKAAKSFGWFRTTLRRLATKVGDKPGDDWTARLHMIALLRNADLVRIRQEEFDAFEQIDVLHVEYEELQSLSNREHSKLRRERDKRDAGQPVHWTIRHWSEFSFSPAGAAAESVIDTDSLSPDTDSLSHPNGKSCHRQKNSVGDTRGLSTTAHETRRDETTDDERARGVEADLAPAIEVFVECSRGGVDASAWRQQLLLHRKAHPAAPIDRYLAAALQMRATAETSGRPFNLQSGWKWFDKAWRSLAQDEHDAGKRRLRAVQAEPGTSEYGKAMWAALGSPGGAA